MEHMKFAADLGFLVARAKFAAENPDLEEKLGFWKQIPTEERVKLLHLNTGFLPEERDNE